MKISSTRKLEDKNVNGRTGRACFKIINNSSNKETNTSFYPNTL